MKDYYKEYDDILFIDGTYNLNENNYACYNIVVQDCNGHNQFINFALTAYKREQSLETILDMFIANNNITNKTKVVMIDKNLSEYKSIKAIFHNKIYQI